MMDVVITVSLVAAGVFVGNGLLCIILISISRRAP